MARQFHALDGLEIRKGLLRDLEALLNKITHDAVGFRAKGVILATVKRNLELDELLSESTTYPSIVIGTKVNLNPHLASGDKNAWPWTVTFHVDTPNNAPTERDIIVRGYVTDDPEQMGANAAQPAPAKQENRPFHPMPEGSSIHIPQADEAGLTAEERSADPRFAPTGRTAAGLEIEAGNEPSPFGEGNLPSAEETQAMLKEQRELQERNKRAEADTGIILTDVRDGDVPDEFRRATGQPIPGPKQVQMSAGDQASVIQGTVDKTFDERADTQPAGIEIDSI